MDLGSKIYELRKKQGFSQEQLAESLGVSRQAVSKWETGQAIPELDKVILLCDLFQISSDWLLGREDYAKQAKCVENEIKQKQNWAQSGAIVGTILNGVGLILAIFFWLEWQRVFTIAIGLVFMLAGMMVFVLGQTEEKNLMIKERVKWQFIGINCWIMLFIPSVMVYNTIIGIKYRFFPAITPIPIGVGGSTLIIWAISYIGVSVLCTYWAKKKIYQAKEK